MISDYYHVAKIPQIILAEAIAPLSLKARSMLGLLSSRSISTLYSVTRSKVTERLAFHTNVFDIPHH
jgi:hypothetical protein